MAEEKKKKPANQLSIELTEDMAEGVYSNAAVISHTNAEIILDFVRILPNNPKARVKSRVVITPQHAKRLLRALADNVQKFEQQFGPIQEQSGGGDKGPQFPPMNFTPTAQA